MIGYKFSQRSFNNLKGVYPGLVACVVIALYKFTEVDFVVIDGVRTMAQQRKEVQSGDSDTLDSKHLIQPDGFAHAVDLAPWVNGRIPWKQWKYFRSISKGMFMAANFLDIELTWGGNWQSMDGPHYET